MNATEADWAYKHEDVSYPYLVPEFHLHWNINAKENVQKPSPGDRILLCQRTRVTHLVKVLDDIVYEDRHFPDFPFQRRVQVMWMAPNPWDEAPHQNEVFGFDFRFRHGKAINLENVTALEEYFGDEGGIVGFRERVKEKLALRI